MPLIVTSHELSPGMRLDEAFTFKGRIMLPGGKVLSDEDISVLRRKYPRVTFRITDPILDSLAPFEDDSKEREIAHTARQTICATIAEVHQRFAAQSSLGGIDFNKARSAVADVMEFLAQNPVSAALLDRNLDGESPLAEHAGTVFYLSMVLGAGVRDYVMRERQRQTSCTNLSGSIAMNLTALGLGSMFMDIGMMPLAHVFEPGYELTEADRAAIREHPRVGAELLPDNLPTGVKMVVRTHHENFDGSGYPAAAAGPSLHVFTRIVRICDAFAAATSDRAFRGAKTMTRAIWEMSVGPFRRFYDPVLMKVFTSLIQPFPIGGKVRLADGRLAVVVKYNRKCPPRPTLIVAFDGCGERLPAGEIRVIQPDEQGPDSPTRIAGFEGEKLDYLHTMPVALMDSEDIAHAGERGFSSLLEAAYP